MNGQDVHEAAEHGHLNISKLLIENKADVNAKDEDGTTPLNLVDKSKYPDLYDLLKSHQM